MMSCSVPRSSVRTATAFFSRPFRPSSCFSRFIPFGSKPAYRFFRLKNVAGLILAVRQIAANGVPASPCFRMNAFASVNLEAFILLTSTPLPARKI